MRNRLFLALIVFTLPALCVAADFPTFNIKEGLWEQTTTHSMTGMPQQSVTIPPEALAKMTPDQRAKVEAMMSGRSSTDVSKVCITKEKLAKNAIFSKDRGNCTRTVVTATGSKLELKIHCQDGDAVSDGNMVLEAMTTEGTKGTMHLVTKSGSEGNALKMDFTFTSKYLGPACGDVK
jgi:hypothetical protein